MAYDKLIDSAKLDAAMNATADAIRGKTGGSADIPWNESTGFASAIAAIASGTSGGSQVAMGTFLSSDEDKGNPAGVNYNQWTIAGLGFKPSTVIIFVEPALDVMYYELTNSMIFAIRLGDYTWCIHTSIISREEEDENGEIYSYDEYGVFEYDYNHATGEHSDYTIFGKIVPTDDGFVFTTNINININYNRPYKYIAIG